uniref:Uncharacterized protein n=1 Tax=Anopheles atroparvus TaxID=41427 RepID=A0A182INM0_ANOAO
MESGLGIGQTDGDNCASCRPSRVACSACCGVELTMLPGLLGIARKLLGTSRSRRCRRPTERSLTLVSSWCSSVKIWFEMKTSDASWRSALLSVMLVSASNSLSATGMVGAAAYGWRANLDERAMYLGVTTRSSSASLADVLTPSPDFCDFSIMLQARSTKAGTVSSFSCFGISTSVQYCVSSRMTSCRNERKIDTTRLSINEKAS